MRARLGWTVAAVVIAALAVSFFVRFGAGTFSVTYVMVVAGLAVAAAGAHAGAPGRVSAGLLLTGAGYLLVAVAALLDGAPLDAFTLADLLAAATFAAAGPLVASGRAWGAALPAAAWLLLAVLVASVGFVADAGALVLAAGGAGVAATERA